MKEFEKDYRKWGREALICVVLFVFTIVTADAFLGFDLSRNMYLMAVVATGCMMTLISLSWISILNSKLMRTDLVGPDRHASGGKREDGVSITTQTIERCIRKEGYVPQPEEEIVSFKIAGERYEVYYQDEKFTILKKFGIGEDIDKELLLKACSQAHDEIFMLRSYTHTYDDGRTLLCFEVETYVRSETELERYFPQYLNVMNAGVERHREIYHHMLEEALSHKPEAAARTVSESKVVS